MPANTRTNQGGSQERAESGTFLVMFVVKLSAPLVAAMKGLRNTSGAGMKKSSEDDWLLLCQWLYKDYTPLWMGSTPFRVRRMEVQLGIGRLC